MKFTQKQPILLTLVIMLALGNLFNAKADSYQWAGNGIVPSDHNWTTIGNWYDVTAGATATAYPSSGDNVEITTTSGAHDPTWNTNITIAGLIVDLSSTLSGDGAHSLTVNGNISMGANINSSINLQGSNLSVTGSITGGYLNCSGTETITMSGTGAGSFAVTGISASSSTLIFNGSGAQTISPGNLGTFAFWNVVINNTYTSGVSLINTASSMFVYGNLSGTGKLAPGANTVRLGGDMTIASYTYGTSLFSLEGTSLQHLNSQTFYNLQSNNSSGTQLTGNVSVRNNLNFATHNVGNIILNGYFLSLSLSGATVTVASTAIDNQYDGSLGYIEMDNGLTDGYFKMYASTTYKIFPVGPTAQDYTPIGLQTTTGSTLTSVKVGTGVLDGMNTPQQLVGVGNYDNVVNCTWIVNPAAAHIFTVTTQWNDGTNGYYTSAVNDELALFDNTQAYLAYRANQSDGTHWVPLTPSYSTTGTAASAAGGNYNGGAWYLTSTANTPSFTAGHDYFIAAGSSSAPLPVSLVNFTAAYDAGAVDLSWTTSSEINNSYFEIERSVNGQAWNAIGQVAGHGNSNSIENYSYTDHLSGIIPAGAIYYRLKQVDFNDKYTYSPIRTVNLSSTAPNLITYPNPTTSTLNVNWISASLNVSSVRLVNINGIAVYQQNVSGLGQMEQKIDMQGFPKGTYFLQIGSDNNNIMSQTILKN